MANKLLIGGIVLILLALAYYYYYNENNNNNDNHGMFVPVIHNDSGLLQKISLAGLLQMMISMPANKVALFSSPNTSGNVLREPNTAPGMENFFEVKDSTSFFKKSVKGGQLLTYFGALLLKDKVVNVTMPNGVTYSLMM